MGDAERIAALERENRILRIMLDLPRHQRRIFRRLTEGPAKHAELLAIVEADHSDAVDAHAVYTPIRMMRQTLRAHGVALLAGGSRGDGAGYRIEGL